MSSHQISPEPALTVGAVALLPLPGLTDLSEPQERGKACVWDAVILNAETAVDLGVRRIPLDDGFLTVFPRACRSCVAKRAHRALVDHAASCEQCADNAALCDTGRALNRLAREHRR